MMNLYSYNSHDNKNEFAQKPINYTNTSITKYNKGCKKCFV